VLSDLLCFAVNKFGRIANKPLKAVMLDFYPHDDISTAKDLLLNEMDKVLLDKWPRPARRRKDSVNRSTTEIDDILNTIALADNRKILDQLSMFVSSDPDKMPSVKLTDGDLAVVLLKLSKIEFDQGSIQKGVDELKVLSSDRNKSQNRPSSVYNRQPPTVSASNVPAEMPTTDGAETDEFDGFTTHQGRKRKKASTSPQTNNSAAAMSFAAAASKPPQRRPGPQPRQSRPTIIGASSSCPVRASKTLTVQKAVYRLGNIDSDYTVNEIEEYIRSLGVAVLSCFELKHSDRQPLDNKAFRVCIAASDKQKFCDINSWSIGVSLRAWDHRPKTTTTTASSADTEGIQNSGTNSTSLQNSSAGNQVRVRLPANAPDNDFSADDMQELCDDK
jgi:hypothetical protein